MLIGGVDIFGVELPIARLPDTPLAPPPPPPPKRDLKFFDALPSPQLLSTLSILNIRVIPVPDERPPPPPPLAPPAVAADVAPFRASSFSWTETKVS